MPNASILSENTKMRLEFEAQGDSILFRPVGILDEDVNFSIILETLTKMAAVVKSVRFDMGHVKRMNSCGVREWILLMERMPAQFPLSFHNVNELIIEQANMIPGMFGKRGGKVHSFQMPFHCPACSKDVSVTTEPQKVPRENGKPRAPEQTCPTCSGPLDFDWIEEEYFAFLAKQ